MSPLGSSLKPQALMLTFLAWYVYGLDVAVFSGSAIEVLDRLGVPEQATRSVLARMVHRGLLERHRRGRRVYFGLTDHASAVLRDGRRRLDEPIDAVWDGCWTLVAFSMPQAWRSERHRLRARLVWARFGLLQSGVWIAPYRADIVELVEGLGVSDHLTVFRARADVPTVIEHLVSEAFDLTTIAVEYEAFLARWQGTSRPESRDSLRDHLLVQAEWLRLVRIDPRLPLQHLPEAWPALRAEALFRRLTAELTIPAAAEADAILDLLPLPRG